MKLSSVQIQEELGRLNDFMRLLSSLLLEEDKESSLELLSRIQGRLRDLTDRTERIQRLIEEDHLLIQEALQHHEQDTVDPRDKKDREIYESKREATFSSEVSPSDTPDTRMPQPSEVVYYIKSEGHQSSNGYYTTTSDEETRFQISVSSSDSCTGILQFYSGLDEAEKSELIGSRSIKLIDQDSSPLSSSSSTSFNDGEVHLDPENQLWKLIKPIVIKS